MMQAREEGHGCPPLRISYRPVADLIPWLPIVGDALTVIAGALRVSLPVFLLLVGLGKFLRYGFVAWAALFWTG